MRRALSITTLVVGVGLAGCAHTAVPTDQLAAAQANISRAEQVGAAQNPDAAYHLRLAHQQLDEGQKLIANEDNLEASYVLKRSAADGELAMAIANYGTASSEAEQARARLQSLRERANSPSSGTVPGTSSDIQ